MSELDAMRIDKWLWAARFFKTRLMAQEAVGLGRVLLAGQRMKASREVKPGDRLTIERSGETFHVVVEGLSHVRGPAPVAQKLYRETAESLAARMAAKERARFANEPSIAITGGRPTKRDARRLAALRETWEEQ